MRDLFEEVKELEAAVDEFRQEERKGVSDWLEELLEIKKARLSLEVFFHQEYDLVPDEEQEAMLEDGVCHRCQKRAMVDRGARMICSNCGAVRRNK